MRVLHLLKTSFGASWALRQIRELQSLGIDVHVALPGNGPMVGRYAAVGATEHLIQTDFPLRTPWTFPVLAAKFHQLVDEVKPDVIHSHFVGTTLTMRLALGRNHTIPRVFQVPGPLHMEHSFYRRAEIASSGTVDYWIGSCQWTCIRYRQSGIDNSRIFLSYYGTDIEMLQRRPTGSLRKELGVDGQTKIIGMVAYMYAPKKYLGQRRGLKGHEDLIDAIAICQERNRNLLCVIVGGAWNNAMSYEKALHDFARQKCGNRVVFLGTRHDVPDLYADFNVVAHPSHSESVGGAAESLLLAVPTIATRVGGFPDIVRDGITGWLVPPKDPPMLAEAIMNALNCPLEAHKRAQTGQQLAREFFDVRRTGAEIADIYKTICSSEMRMATH